MQSQVLLVTAVYTLITTVNTKCSPQCSAVTIDGGMKHHCRIKLVREAYSGCKNSNDKAIKMSSPKVLSPDKSRFLNNKVTKDINKDGDVEITMKWETRKIITWKKSKSKTKLDRGLLIHTEEEYLDISEPIKNMYMLTVKPSNSSHKPSTQKMQYTFRTCPKHPNEDVSFKLNWLSLPQRKPRCDVKLFYMWEEYAPYEINVIMKETKQEKCRCSDNTFHLTQEGPDIVIDTCMNHNLTYIINAEVLDEKHTSTLINPEGDCTFRYKTSITGTHTVYVKFGCRLGVLCESFKYKKILVNASLPIQTDKATPPMSSSIPVHVIVLIACCCIVFLVSVVSALVIRRKKGCCWLSYNGCKEVSLPRKLRRGKGPKRSPAVMLIYTHRYDNADSEEVISKFEKLLVNAGVQVYHHKSRHQQREIMVNLHDWLEKCIKQCDHFIFISSRELYNVFNRRLRLDGNAVDEETGLGVESLSAEVGCFVLNVLRGQRYNTKHCHLVSLGGDRMFDRRYTEKLESLHCLFKLPNSKTYELTRFSKSKHEVSLSAKLFGILLKCIDCPNVLPHASPDFHELSVSVQKMIKSLGVISDAEVEEDSGFVSMEGNVGDEPIDLQGEHTEGCINRDAESRHVNHDTIIGRHEENTGQRNIQETECDSKENWEVQNTKKEGQRTVHVRVQIKHCKSIVKPKHGDPPHDHIRKPWGEHLPIPLITQYRTGSVTQEEAGRKMDECSNYRTDEGESRMRAESNNHIDAGTHNKRRRNRHHTVNTLCAIHEKAMEDALEIPFNRHTNLSQSQGFTLPKDQNMFIYNNELSDRSAHLRDLSPEYKDTYEQRLENALAVNDLNFNMEKEEESHSDEDNETQNTDNKPEIPDFNLKALDAVSETNMKTRFKDEEDGYMFRNEFSSTWVKYLSLSRERQSSTRLTGYSSDEDNESSYSNSVEDNELVDVPEDCLVHLDPSHTFGTDERDPFLLRSQETQTQSNMSSYGFTTNNKNDDITL